MAFEPKFVTTARLIPRPLVRRGKISDTINQLMGPNDTYNTQNTNQSIHSYRRKGRIRATDQPGNNQHTGAMQQQQQQGNLQETYNKQTEEATKHTEKTIQHYHHSL